jgi:4-amino-4-deoxy-L-arabinose transferase-like glycosyltransferase
MAISKAMTGVCGPFVVVPVAGALLVLSTYLLGVRLGSRTLGLLAMLLLVTSPPFLLMNFQNMSDVPVAAALAFASWCLFGTTIRSAAGASVALAVALLIRPNLVPLVPVFLAWLGWRMWRGPSPRGRHTTRALIASAGVGVGSLATLAIYWFTYGSPFESGYGATSAYFSSSYFLPNLRNYTQWFSEVQTPLVFLGFVALACPIARVWPVVVDRSAIVACAVVTAIVVGEFLFYLVLDNSSYLRFLLVCYPFIMLGVASSAMALARVHRWIGPLAGAALVIIVCARGSWVSWDWDVFGQGLYEAKYADTADHVRRFTPENSVVLAMQHSGSLRYYAGRVTLRWDLLDVEWLDRAVAWMAEHGVHTYALLDEYEQVEAVRRFKNQKVAAILEGPPVFRFGNKLFYDLGLPPGTPIQTLNVPVVDVAPKCWPPASPPAIVWKK